MILGNRFDRTRVPWPYTPERVRGIAKSALRGFSRVQREEYRLHDREQHARLWAALQGMRFAARAMAYEPEPDHLATHVRISRAFEHVEPDAYGHSAFVAQCMAVVVAAAEEPGPVIEHLAREGGLEARVALAGSLRLDRPAHLGLLRTLLRDVAPKVRKAARARLAKVEEVPWWARHLSRDPLPFFGTAKAKQARGQKQLRRLFDALDEVLDGETRAGVESALVALPRAVAIDLLQGCLAFPRDDEHHAVLLNALCALEGAEADEALFERAERWTARPAAALVVGGMFRSYAKLVEARTAGAEGAKTSALAASEEERVRRCVALARRLVAEGSGESDPLRGDPRAVLFEFIAGTWPEGADPSGLLDVLLGAPPATGASARPLEQLGELVGKGFGKGMSKALRKRAEGALLQGLPGAWGYLAEECRALVEKGPRAKARTAAQALLANPESNVESRAWALEVLATRGYDAERDPSYEELVRRWLANPATREALFAGRGALARALPVVREELAAGRCTWDEAVSVTEHARALWTGWEPDPRETEWKALRASLPARMKPMQRFLKYACERRAALGAWLCAGERVGPLRDDEWAAVRALRAAAEKSGADVLDAVVGEDEADTFTRRLYRQRDVVPERSTRWTPQERARIGAFVEEAISRYERGVEANAFFVCLLMQHLLAGTCDEACVPYFERLGDLPSGEYFDPVVPARRELYEAFCARMGTDPDPEFFAKARAKKAKKGEGGAAGAKPKPKSDDGWGDDDDEDEDE